MTCKILILSKNRSKKLLQCYIVMITFEDLSWNSSELIVIQNLSIFISYNYVHLVLYRFRLIIINIICKHHTIWKNVGCDVISLGYILTCSVAHPISFCHLHNCSFLFYLGWRGQKLCHFFFCKVNTMQCCIYNSF